MVTILAIIIVLLLMTVVIFFILKNTVSNINEQGRVYFTLKLQQYEKEYEKVNKDKERNKGLEENVQKVKDITSIKPSGSLVYVDEKLDYQVSDLLAIVKKIEKGFVVDKEEIIKAFIKEKTDKVLKGLTACELDCLDYKYFKITPKEYFEEIGFDFLSSAIYSSTSLEWIFNASPNLSYKPSPFVILFISASVKIFAISKRLSF